MNTTHYNHPPEIKEEASRMIGKYGYEESERHCMVFAKDYLNEINTMAAYDEELIKKLERKVWYWQSVAAEIRQARQ